MSITIVGLGPGPAALLTEEAKQVLTRAQNVYLRTRKHPVAAEIASRDNVRSFDEAFEAGRDHDSAIASVVEILNAAHGLEEIVYAVPGHPLVGDTSVTILLDHCREHEVSYRIVRGLSLVEPACAALNIDAVATGLQLVDAFNPILEPNRPAIIFNVSERLTSLKAVLIDLYPPDHELAVIDYSKGTVLRTTIVENIEALEYASYSLCLYTPALELTRNLRTLNGLQSIVAYLRSPDGCPWDQAQSHASLKPFLLEETYEALEALDEANPAKLKEELGDVLFEVLLQTQVAEDEGEFHLSEVVHSIASKLVRRHPHVFGDEAVSSAKEVEQRWDVLKQAERGREESALAGVPTTTPALAYAQALLARAARTGFQWPGIDDVLSKLHEEVAELAEAKTGGQKKDELGDILINIINAARFLELDAEESLRIAANKFRRRFITVERLAKERGRAIGDMELTEMQVLWQEAKGLAG